MWAKRIWHQHHPHGRAYIASNVWKIVVIVPTNSSSTALSRITATNRVIAISIPNVTNGLSSDWREYVTIAQKIEQDTGFTFFTALPADIASALRVKVDGTPEFLAPVFNTNQFRFTVNGWTGTNYIVEAATNLASANWIPLLTNAAPFTFIQSNAGSFGQRFYRAKLW